MPVEALEAPSLEVLRERWDIHLLLEHGKWTKS